jgi:hypothetical protein
LATNEIDVLNAILPGMPGRSRLNGRWDWPTRIPYSITRLTDENPRTLRM